MIQEAFFKFFYQNYSKDLLLDLFSLIFLLITYSFSLKKLNFADDNTICVGSKDLTELLEIL